MKLDCMAPYSFQALATLLSFKLSSQFGLESQPKTLRRSCAFVSSAPLYPPGSYSEANQVIKVKIIIIVKF